MLGVLGAPNAKVLCFENFGNKQYQYINHFIDAILLYGISGFS